MSTHEEKVIELVQAVESLVELAERRATMVDGTSGSIIWAAGPHFRRLVRAWKAYKGET